MTSSQTLSFNGVKWDILNNPTAIKFGKFLCEHVDTCREFYFIGDKAEEIKDEIDKIVYMLGKAPTNNMNKLHEHFADHEDDDEMERLNNLIHYYELSKSNFPGRWGYFPGKNVGAELVLDDEDAKQFTLQRKPGYLYINYAHVGKHYAEIVFSNDYKIKKSQYVPQHLARPSFFCWLGKEFTKKQLDMFEMRGKELHEKLKTRLELPEYTDPEMRIGYIPFAKLQRHINTNELSNMLLKHKGKNTNYMELFNAGQRRV